DDSFSALDFKTDANLRRALKEEVTDAYIVIVAQRVSSVMDADRILVLENGEVKGIGTHNELLKMSEVYQEIVTAQQGEEETGGATKRKREVVKNVHTAPAGSTDEMERENCS